MGRAIALLLLLACTAASAAPLRDRWVYSAHNLAVDGNVDELAGILRTAAAAGYNGVVIADAKLSLLDRMDAHYFANVERLKRTAAELHLQIVPAVFPLGYSAGLLAHDPNLAEGLPVRDALFVVQDGVARPTADPPVALHGGDMTRLSDWDWKDPAVAADRGTARMNPRGRQARLVQKLHVAPFRQYHIAVRVRTDRFRGTANVAVLANRHGLQYADLGVQPSQGWTWHHAVFNSLQADEVTLYLTAEGGTGSVWWDDASIEETGLVNVVRRDGAPLAVRRETGEPLREGTDFDAVADPRLGVVPWPGAYEVWHAPPALRTRLPDGTRLRISYFHAVVVARNHVMACLSEPKTLDLLRDEMRRIHALFGAHAYFMSHDEIRVLNWDEACTRRGLTPGAILADNVRACTRIVQDTAPGARVFVWSDMFDPNHNAHAGYYLVNGDLRGSWEGLDPDVVVACWYFEKRAESLAFFAGRGHKTLIAGYYDAAPRRVQEWLRAGAATGAVEGVMYTTWKGQYADVRTFGRLVADWR